MEKLSEWVRSMDNALYPRGVILARKAAVSWLSAAEYYELLTSFTGAQHNTWHAFSVVITYEIVLPRRS